MEHISTGKNSNDHEKLVMKLFNNLLLLILAIFIFILSLALALTIQLKTDFASALKTITESVGPLGDTLGGTMGPLVGVIASIFTYWAFMEQVEANRKQADQFKVQFEDQQKANFRDYFFKIFDLFLEKKKVFETNSITSIMDEIIFAYKGYVSFDSKGFFSLNKYNEYNNVREKNLNDTILETEISSLSLACKLVFLGRSLTENEVLSKKESKIRDKLLRISYEVTHSEWGFDESNYSPEHYEAYSLVMKANGPGGRVMHEIKKEKLFFGKPMIREYLSHFSFILDSIHTFNSLKKDEKDIYYSFFVNQLSERELDLLYVVYVSGYGNIISDEKMLESKLFRNMYGGRIKIFLSPQLFFKKKFEEIKDFSSLLK